ncbi:hypothetical protein Hanom_Chr06g00487901 [Helianthus anomalus]
MKGTDIEKIGDMSVNIADNIGTDILTDILHHYLTRELIIDISVIYRDINYIVKYKYS